MRTFIILIALLASSGLAAENASNVENLKWLKDAEPTVDAKKALEKGDLRLKAVYGYSLYIPGTKPEQFTNYKNKYGVMPIEGTSDVIESEEHKKLNHLAVEYAEQYNSIILKGGK